MTRRVLIVGGGLAGLALAHGLKRATPAIPFRIFERDSNAGFRAQGYRIRITGDALKALLPPQVFAKFEATASPIIGRGQAIDALTGQHDPTAFMPGPPPGALHADLKLYNVDRTVLRNVLLQGLEDDISYDKKFESYKILGDDSIQVTFADGSVEQGSLLVGADGVRSGIRKQLLPDFPMVDSEGRSVFGKTDLTKDLIASLPENFLTGMNLAGPPKSDTESRTPPLKLLFEVMKFDPAARSLDVGVPKDYIYWVLCTREDVIPPEQAGLQNLLSLSSAGSTALANELTKDWHESVRAIMKTPNDDSTATLAFFSCTKDGLPQSWEQMRHDHAGTPVTLIGDAAHPMPPVGGVGANSAFQDALELLQSLEGSVGKSETQQDALVQYETMMVGRVEAAVERSNHGAVRFFGMRPPSELKAVSI